MSRKMIPNYSELKSKTDSYIAGQTKYADAGLTTQMTPPGIFI
jgi:hypothetical protein